MIMQPQSYRVLAPSVDLPVSLDEARQQLRNEDLNYDDDYIIGLIRTATNYIERTYGLALLTQSIEQNAKRFPCSDSEPLHLRIAPLVSITSIKYLDSDGTEQTWAAENYYTGNYNNRPFVIPKVGKTWPSGVTTQHPAPITIVYSAGFGKPLDVMPIVRQALLMYVGDLYENRGDPVRNMSTATDRMLMGLYPFSC